MAVQQAPYQLLERDGMFEIRYYEPLILAISPETDLSGSSGFGRLFNFISGDNRDRRKIAMTAPVLNDLGQQQLTIAFVMPHEYQAGTVPQPKDPAVRIREVPARKVAAVVLKVMRRPGRSPSKGLPCWNGWSSVVWRRSARSNWRVIIHRSFRGFSNATNYGSN